ncbi:MAG: aminotransferase class V-fold PLP-dependent enzyme, partial [Selenomonadaceae bacterium]|nr:aminotransferase class V-fold PLP-dependent enzyme [Selenomonadaceae bacterium]
LKLLPYIDGGAQEFSKRAGTENFPAIAAMALALEKNCRDMNQTAKKISTCAKILLDCLKSNGVDFIVNGGENHLPGHLSLSFRDCEGETLLHRLDLKNICVSTGSACNSQQMQTSHVLQALAVPEDYIRGTIRITFGKENFYEDAKFIGKHLSEIAGAHQRKTTMQLI